jgi:purine-binding chemotaxis protein CheW
MSEMQQFCTFVLDQSLFGLEVERVQEIIRYQELTRIPLAPEEVAGLINLRGQIVPAIDLRRCLRLPARTDEGLPTNVVIRTEDGALSLLVDQIGDVVDVSEDAYESSPDNLPSAVRDLIRGVYKLDGQLLLILATEAAIARATEPPRSQNTSSAAVEGLRSFRGRRDERESRKPEAAVEPDADRRPRN